MITNFKVSEDEKTVSWENEGRAKRLLFEYPVAANHIVYLDEVIVQSDTRENGETNLAIYKADGLVKVRPEMPKRKHKVAGVYAVWFGQGKKRVPVVLLSDEYRPYDTACTFDLETHQFFDFHPTK